MEPRSGKDSLPDHGPWIHSQTPTYHQNSRWCPMKLLLNTHSDHPDWNGHMDCAVVDVTGRYLQWIERQAITLLEIREREALDLTRLSSPGGRRGGYLLGCTNRFWHRANTATKATEVAASAERCTTPLPCVENGASHGDRGCGRSTPETRDSCCHGMHELEYGRVARFGWQGPCG